MLKTLEEVFSFILNNEKTLLYGNLGRLLHALVAHISHHHPTLDVIVFSRYYKIPNVNNHIRILPWQEGVRKKCDLFIYAEPDKDAILNDKPLHAARYTVLTSHHVFEVQNGNPIFAEETYYHTHSMSELSQKTKRLLALQAASDQAKTVQAAKDRIDFPTVVSLGPEVNNDVTVVPGKAAPSIAAQSYVIVNLINTVDSVAMMLACWDAFDYMMENIDRVERWSVCFGERRTKQFEDFVQESINRMFCRNYDNLRELLSVVPFYKSGIVDRHFDVNSQKFCDFDYYVAETLEDAFKACAKHDLVRVVGNAYRFK